MRPFFHPRLINGPFDDPGLLISQLFSNRAILFDLGDIHCLSPREILKISHVFVSHTHMDHFMGFDRLLRLMLGRQKTLHLYGPEGFIKNVEGKLSGFSWNLVKNYENRFLLRIFEIHTDLILARSYACADGFAPGTEEGARPFSARLLSEPAFDVSAVILDHDIPCLGFSLMERFHVNIKKDAVLNLGVNIGPWINAFKAALYEHPDGDADFTVCGQAQTWEDPRVYRLKDLADRITTITPGQKITYIADVAWHPSNAAKIIDFAYESDHLFIEAAFLEKHMGIAKDKRHLTARQAGDIAKKARVKRLTIFHFSPRYIGMEQRLYREANLSFEAIYTP
jgi:ribonuclease Z